MSDVSVLEKLGVSIRPEKSGMNKGDRVAVRVPVEKVRPDPHNYRGQLRDEDVEDLYRGLEGRGHQEHPIGLRPDPEIPGGYVIVYGHRRAFAVQRLYQEALANQEPTELYAEVLAFIDDYKTELDIFLAQKDENGRRSSVPAIRLAKRFKQLKDKYRLSTEELAERTKEDVNALSVLLLIAEADTVVQGLLDKYPLSVDDSYLIVRIAKELPTEQRDEILAKLIRRRFAGEVSSKFLRTYHQKAKRGELVDPAADDKAATVWFEVKDDALRFRAAKLPKGPLDDGAVQDFLAQWRAACSWLKTEMPELAGEMVRGLKGR